jgi:hypothetical protein
MMGRIYEGPTSATSKPGPASLPQGQRSGPIRRATSDSCGHPSYLDGRLHLAQPKAPSAAIHRPGPPGGAATWRELPRTARDMQEQQGTWICLVRRSGHDEIFPDVGNRLFRCPITWILNSGKGHGNPFPAKH